jgi:hypothetical protein
MVSSAIEDLDEAAFGFRPAKPGTAYERLSAVVLATLGWLEVMHDTTESVPGKLAEHQLDVTGRHPSGEIRRLIVECKDWDQVVDQATLDKLVGIRAQVGADAGSVVTTKGYTAGALAVAVDENIGLWRLRPFDPENPELYVKQITLTLIAVVSTYSDVTVEVPEDRFPAGTPTQARAWTSDRLLHGDGSLAETLQQVLEGQRAKLDEEAGPYPRQVSFSDGRLLPVEGSNPVPIVGGCLGPRRCTEAHTRRSRKPGESPCWSWNSSTSRGISTQVGWSSTVTCSPGTSTLRATSDRAARLLATTDATPGRTLGREPDRELDRQTRWPGEGTGRSAASQIPASRIYRDDRARPSRTPRPRKRRLTWESASE